MHCLSTGILTSCAVLPAKELVFGDPLMPLVLHLPSQTIVLLKPRTSGFISHTALAITVHTNKRYSSLVPKTPEQSFSSDWSDGC